MAQQHTPPRDGGPAKPGGPLRRLHPRPRPWRGGRGGGAPAGTRLPWVSTVLLTVFVLVATGFAARGQPDRAGLDVLARLLLACGSLVLLWRWRFPVVVVFTTAGAALVYLAGGYPYGPVFLTVAVGCYAAVMTGHRRAAWGALAMLWGGHLLVGHWLYSRLPPSGDGPTAPGAPNSASPPGSSRSSPSASSSECAASSGRRSARTGPGRRGAGPTRSGCGSPANSMTCSHTASP